MALHRREGWRGTLAAAAAAAAAPDGAGPSPNQSQSLRDLLFDPAGYHPTIMADGARCTIALLAGAALMWLAGYHPALVWGGRNRMRQLGAALGLGGGGKGGGPTPDPNPAWGGGPNPHPAGGGPFYASACVALLCASLVGRLGLSWLWLGLPLALLTEAHRAPRP